MAYGAKMNLDKKSGFTLSYNQKVQKIVQKFKSSSLSTSLILENDTNVKTVKSVFEKKILFNSLCVQIYRE